MATREPLTNDEGEVRELTDEDFEHAISFSDLPPRQREILLSLKKTRSPEKAPTK